MPDRAEEPRPPSHVSSERTLAALSARSQRRWIGGLVGMVACYGVAGGSAALARTVVADHCGVVLGRSLRCARVDAPAHPGDRGGCLDLVERGAAQPVHGGS